MNPGPPLLERYDYLFKIILVGDASVGKTGITLRLCEESYTSSYVATIGIDFKIRTLDVDGKKIKLQIWDTAGQERFRTLTKVYYRGATGAMFVYDITKQSTFENIQSWVKVFQDMAGSDVQRMLIGNKCDKYAEREVSYERANLVAMNYKMKFYETSAKTGHNIEDAFYSLTRDIIHYRENLAAEDVRHPGMVLRKKSSRRKSKSWFHKCSLF